jgi:hypothetical protein
LGAPLPVLAHDFWIEPSGYRPAVGEVVHLRLRVGERFVGDPVPRNPALLDRFVAATAGGIVDVPGVDGADPAGVLRIAEPGTIVVGYRSRRSPLELPAERFEEYLAQEGLERILELRATRGQSALPGREVFSRCAKSLLAAGTGGEPASGLRLGLDLELVSEADPTRLAAPGAQLPLTLLYRGEPLASALVRARSSADPSAFLAARTDGSGRVTLALTHAGPWLVTAVHMVEAPADTGADWESLWASLTFELPAVGDG